MATKEYRLATPQPIRMRFRDSAGIPITDLDFKLAIPLPATCAEVIGVLDGDSYLFDLSGLTLPPRLYRVEIKMESGPGWEWQGGFNLNVIGGC